MIGLFAPPTVEYCERASKGLVKRPWYFVSNLAFLISGFLILKKGKFDALSKLFGFSAILIGVLSSIYDLTFTRWSQITDLSGMFLFATVILFVVLNKIFPGRATQIWTALFIFFGFTFATMVITGGYSGDVIFGCYVIIICLAEYYLSSNGRHSNYRNWLIGLSCLAVGFVFWILDVTQTVCFKLGLLNGRSIFHFLTAVTIYYVYLFYASQNEPLKLK